MSNELSGLTGFCFLPKNLEQKGIEVNEQETSEIIENIFDEKEDIFPQEPNDASYGLCIDQKNSAPFDDAQKSLFDSENVAGEAFEPSFLLDEIIIDDIETQENKTLSKKNNGEKTINIGSFAIPESAYNNVKQEIANAIELKKQELSDEKENRGWATKFANGVKELFGGGDKKAQKEIEKLERAYESLETYPNNLANLYKTVTGKELDLESVSNIQEANDFANSLSDDARTSIVECLEAQLDAVQESFDDTKEHNGFFSRGWDKFKNWTGIGASSNKTQTELNNAYEQLKAAKDNPEELVKAYKNITGKDLTPEEFEKLYNGETSLMAESKAASKVSSYTQGQEMFTDIFADVVVGFVCASEAIALGVAGFFTGGAAWAAAPGALLATRTALGAVMKPAIKGFDAKTGGREYTFKDGIYDAVTGGINGATAGLSKGIASAMSTGAGKVAGLPFAQRLIGSSFGKTASKIASSKVGSVVVGFTTRSAERAVDGFIGASADGAARAALEGRYDDILSDAWAYGKAGAAGSVILGGTMDLAGGGLKKLSGAKNSADELSDAASEAGSKPKGKVSQFKDKAKEAIKEKLKQTKTGQRILDDYEIAKANFLNKVNAQSADARVMSEMSDYLSRVKGLVENQDVLVKNLDNLANIVDEAADLSIDVSQALIKTSQDFAQQIEKQSAFIEDLLQRVANGEDVSKVAADFAQKGIDFSDIISESTVESLNAFGSKMEKFIEQTECCSQNAINFLESVNKNSDEISSLFADAKGIISEIPDTKAFKELGEMPGRVKTVLDDIKTDMTNLSSLQESAFAKIQAGNIKEGLGELDSYYKNMSKMQSKIEDISKQAQKTAQNSGLSETASILAERIKTTTSSDRFAALSSIQKAQSIVEESNIAFSKFIQTMSSDETLPEGVRKFFKEFTSNCTVSRTLDEAQALADEIYGKGKYTLKKSYGAGTIGETYLVVDKNGREFVMKMLKDGVSKQKFEADRAMFTKYIDEFAVDAVDKEYKLQLVNGLFDSWEKELDYGAEALGAKNMADGAKRFSVAQTVEVGSKNGANISLVMEKADGVGLDTLIDLLDFKNKHPHDYMNLSILSDEGKELNPWIKNKGTIDANPWIKDTESYAEQLPVAYQKAQNEQSMFLSQNGVKTVHADPHPGNVFVDFDPNTKTPKITYIDTGNVLTRTNSEVLSDISLSLNMLIGNSEGIATSLLNNATLPKGMTQQAAIEQVSRLLDEKLYKAGINLKDVNYTQATMMGILSDLNIIPDASNSNLLKANLQRIKTSREIFAVTGTEANKSIDIHDMLAGIKQSFKSNPKATMKTIKPIVKWAFKNKDQTLITFFQMMFKESDFT